MDFNQVEFGGGLLPILIFLQEATLDKFFCLKKNIFVLIFFSELEHKEII